jgi:hypothetical protein
MNPSALRETLNETLKVASQIKAGGMGPQHNETLKVGSKVKAGKITSNHNSTLRS